MCDLKLLYSQLYVSVLQTETHPRGCSERTGTGFLLSQTLSGSEADSSSYSGPQTATAFGSPGESRRIFDTSHFFFWRTSRTSDGLSDTPPPVVQHGSVSVN